MTRHPFLSGADVKCDAQHRSRLDHPAVRYVHSLGILSRPLRRHQTRAFLQHIANSHERAAK